MAISFGKILFASVLLVGMSAVWSKNGEKTEEENSREKRGSGAAISKVVETIVDGASIAGTNLNDQMGAESVAVGIELDNYSKWSLHSPSTFLESGHVSVPPMTVQPELGEAMVAHKGYGLTGTWGTASWVVGDTSKRIIVMWSAPYNFDFYSNWLAIGIIKASEDGDTWADTMYYKNTCSFSRAEYDDSAKTIVYCNADFCIDGIMGTAHKSEVRLSFYPTAVVDLAPEIKALLQKDNPDATHFGSNESTSTCSGPETCEKATFIFLATIGICFYIMI